MWASLVLPVLAVLSFSSSAAAQDVCNATQLAPLACLSDFPPAAAICRLIPRQTFTLTVTTTTLDVNTQTVTAHAATQTTVNETTTQWSTKTITTGPARTITTVETSLSTENTVITTYVNSAEIVANAAAATCNPQQAISAFRSLPNGTLAAACSCIGHPARTYTTTSTVTAPAVKTRTTDFAGTAPTTTQYEIVMRTTTLTYHPTRTVTLSTSSCVTSTKILSYAAPTFTHVYGPKPGCADTASASTKTLAASVHDLKEASRGCQDLCAQDSSCSFVYVQVLSTKRGGTPSFQCSFNDHPLDTANDIDCERQVGVYGAANGYNAEDRGTEEL